MSGGNSGASNVPEESQAPQPGQILAAGQPGQPILAAGQQLLQITGQDGNQQQLVLSPEDAATLLAQAGIQLNDNEQVIIGDIGAGQHGVGAEAGDQVTLEQQQQLQAIVDQQQVIQVSLYTLYR
jgi:hypothetical protein